MNGAVGAAGGERGVRDGHNHQAALLPPEEKVGEQFGVGEQWSARERVALRLVRRGGLAQDQHPGRMLRSFGISLFPLWYQRRQREARERRRRTA